MLIPTDHLRQLELAGQLRWLIPFGASLVKGGPPPAGAVFEIAALSGAVFTCRLEGAQDGDSALQYIGPDRPEATLKGLAEALVRSEPPAGVRP